MDDVSVRIILDTSAIIAFTRERIDVGEVIAGVADEPGCAFGLPVLCLAEAARVVDALADLDAIRDRLPDPPA